MKRGVSGLRDCRRSFPGLWPAFLALAGLASIAVLALALPAEAGGVPEYLGNDLVVSAGAPQVYANRTLVVAGNVTVQAGGVLELRNSTVLLNLTANGSKALTVEPTGTLRVLDLDGSSSTAGDRSVVGSADPGLRYTARFKAGANVLFRASTLSGFGFSLAGPGLLIEAANVTFKDSSLESYVFLRVERVSPVFDGVLFSSDGTGSNYFFGSDAALDNCTFQRHFVALSAGDGSALRVSNALVADTTFSFALNGSTLTVSGAAVNNSTSGVFLTNGSLATFTDVDFDPARATFGDNSSELRASRTFFVRVLNLASEGVRNATVTLRDSANLTLATLNTAATGVVGPATLRAFTLNATGRADLANYTAAAVKGAFFDSRAFSALVEPSVLTLILPSNIDPRLTLVEPAAGAALLAGVPALFEVNVTDPDSTPGGVTVSWVSSLAGPLGAGTSLPVTLPEGLQTIEVEARDGAEGYRRLEFTVTVESGQADTVAATSGGLTFNATVWKTSRGSVGALIGAPPSPPALIAGPGFELHSASGTLVWGWALLEVPFNESGLPHGTFAENLTLAHFSAGVWSQVAGAAVNLSRGVLVANISATLGLGWFAVVAVKGDNLPPEVPDAPRLSAVVGVPFTFDVDAVDTPGDTLTFALVSPPSWISVDTQTGLLAGTPGPQDRGLVVLKLSVTAPWGASASRGVELFVSGVALNGPPRLINARVAPIEPVEREAVTIEVTYVDGDDDLPLFVEVLIDGTPQAMDPVELADINATDGKRFTFTAVLAVGAHNISFRTNDGAPGHADVRLAGGDLVVVPDTLRTLNNWVLALLASIAATLVLVVYVRARAPNVEKKRQAPTPEDRVELLSGAALKPIPPQPKLAKPAPEREADLAGEAEALAAQAEKDAESGRAALRPEEKKE